VPWNIRAKLLAGALAAIVGVAALAGMNLLSARTNSRALQAVYERTVVPLVMMQKLSDRLGEIRFRVAGVLLDVMPVQGSLNHLREARKDILGAWAALEDSGQRFQSAEEAPLHEKLVKGWPAVEATLGKIETAYLAKDNKALSAVLDEDWAALHQSFGKPLAGLIPRQEAAANEVYERAVRSNGTLGTLSTVIGLLGAVLTGAMSLWIARGIVHALGQASRATDEIAAGNLGVAIDTTKGDEVGALLRRLEQMRISLLGLVGVVRDGVGSVSEASREIAQGNADLSARTEQQASSLQQTAASMEQMSATVKQNAEAAAKANELAQAASEVAARGGDMVDRVVGTMDEITAQSRKIADIIAVIDGIAFQTNILALNAAVEAARAGEQGRGFAVVAGEVRNLAQRSAEAAREIKTLISDSVQRVESGSALVDRAGHTMRDIVAQVAGVADLIRGITAASQEQSAGVEQVNRAVAHLDEMTQQNSALVEESAAAAESLREQSDRLAKAVAAFRTGSPTARVAPVG
jgi:methyl-accepting chemotaxis protein